MDDKESSRIFSQFATYLTGERGLASATREGYLHSAELFWIEARAEPEFFMFCIVSVGAAGK